MAFAGTRPGTYHVSASLGAGAIAAGCALVATLVLGGGTRPGFLADAVLQLISIPCLLIILWQWQPYEAGQPGKRHARLALMIIAGLVGLHLAQLVPLPPEVWTRLPGREAVSRTFELIGRPPGWMPLSIDPEATWLALLSLLPAIVIFLGALQASARTRRMLVAALLAVATGSALLGLSQLALGPETSLRPYPFTNILDAVGLFANRNHFAALLYCSLVLLFPWGALVSQALGAAWRGEKNLPSSAVIAALLCFMSIVIIISGQAMARSRAGLGLTLIAVIAVFFLPLRLRGNAKVTTSRFMIATMVLAALFALQFALYRNLERFEDDALLDGRIAFARNTVDAAWAFMPFGSGIGTFVPVYGMFEKIADLHSTYANRAHNDFLEAWLETGVPGMALLAVFLVWLLMRLTVVWSTQPTGASSIDALLARAASVAIVLLLAHSLFDYPLRTAAMSGVMALCCALMLPSPRDRDQGQEGRERPREREQEPGEPMEHAPQQRTRRPWSSEPSPVPAAAATPTFDWPGAPPAVAPDQATAASPTTAQPEQGPASGARGKWGEDIAWPQAWQPSPQPPPAGKPASPPRKPPDGSH